MTDSIIGKRLLSQEVDHIAKEDPGRIWASSPCTTNLEDGFHDITFPELAQAVNFTAWWIERHMGRGHNFETLSYMGMTDVRYIVVFLAAIKTGYKLLVPSARNSLSGNLSLLNEMDCVKFVHTPDITEKAKDLLCHKPNMHLYSIPSYEEMVRSASAHYPYDKSFEEAEYDQVFVCHTSGSTGAPKPITINNAHFTTFDNLRKLPKIEGRRNLNYSIFEFNGEGRYYSPFPPFHIGGILAMGMLPIWYNTTVVVGPADRPPSGDIALQILRQQPKLRAIYTPPTTIEQMIQEPGGLKEAARLDFVIYAGGPLSPSTGERLKQVTQLGQIIGSTELGSVPMLFPHQDSWNYFEWHPAYKLDMQETSENVFEMVIPYDPSFNWIRRVCRAGPEEVEWRTRDLFEPHPLHPDRWRFYGRADDIIVLSNGEKFNPVTMEAIIQGHPLLHGALITGTARFQAALIVEVKPGVSSALLREGSTKPKLSRSSRKRTWEERDKEAEMKQSSVSGSVKDDRQIFEEALIDEIWPSIQLANDDGPAMGRIFRSKVLVAVPSKPFIRTGKGTVVRSLTTKDYAEELEALYSDQPTNGGAPRLEDIGSLTAVQDFVRSCVSSLLSAPDLSDDDDFYVNGLDSLQTLETLNVLKIGLKFHPLDPSSLTTKSIYAYPTVSSLSQYVHSLLNPARNGSTDAEDHEASRLAVMKTMVDKYIADLPLKDPERLRRIDSASNDDNLCVLLTGSTGTLGTHILHTLLLDDRVAEIHCFNRAVDARSRYEAVLAGCDLRTLLPAVKDKVVFHTAKFGHPTFGLSETDHAKLHSGVDVIIHNAWKVDFNHSLASFETEHIRGLRLFVDWCLQTSAHLCFVSSIASVAFYSKRNHGAKTVPEAPLTDYGTAQEFGYGESKHVAERILQTASERSGLSVSILRVGQVAGPTKPDGGVWNRHEFLPSMVKTSKEIGVMPRNMQDIDWTPVDDMAQIIVDIAHTDFSEREKSLRERIYHLVNPQVASWTKFVRATQEHYAVQGQVISAVSLREWIDVLKQVDADNPEELITKPSVKILDFYEEVERMTPNAEHLLTSKDAKLEQRYETKNGETSSQTTRRLRAMDADLFHIWLKQWAF